MENKKIAHNTIEVDYNTSDYPDFSDAYAVYAEYEDGEPLTEDELEDISSCAIHSAVLASL